MPKMLRQPTRRLVITRRGEYLTVPPATVAVLDPGFVCQDFATTATVNAYAATSAVDALSAAAVVDAYSATVGIDLYGGTATNCGR
ncbi:hypothetical protein [Amycolatopsis speibonae]|uniref:Uncharacterized protein n=1 Tax=Amycolatopsis speibonae TaxID=1450224 RepID=A0ABV7P6C6_9PSEU